MNQQNLSNLKAFIFDLDGTVVDSALDFDLMRSELGFPEQAPILEELATLTDQSEIDRANEIIHRYELEGVERSTLMPGYLELHNYLTKNNIPIGLLTRNSSHVTRMALEKFNINYDVVLTRDDCLAKPHPEGLNIMKKKWGIQDYQGIYVGDYEFDLITAKAANLYSALYLADYNTDLKQQADIVIDDFSYFLNMIQQ